MTVSGLGDVASSCDHVVVGLHPTIALPIIQHPITQATNCLLL
ncbi:hypothetical protein [Leptolyngbya sp. GB1-A1]